MSAMADYTVSFVPLEDGYVAAVFPDWPNIHTGGEDLAEAAANAQAALEAMIAYYHETGRSVPEPLADFTGQISLRVPKSLQRELKRRAQDEGVSVNLLLNQIIAEALKPPANG